jgi:hypothetical protein
MSPPNGRLLSDALGLQLPARAARLDKEELRMTLCPIALAVGCKKCPAFTVCPLKSVIGDYKKPEETGTKQHAENAPSGVKRDG